MNLFKVIIQDKKPVSASQISYNYLEKIKNDMIEENGVVNWLIILANNEKESIKIATKLIEDIKYVLGPGNK